jgi:hypothetical protein
MTSIPQTPTPDTSTDDVSSVREQALWIQKRVEESIQYIHTKEMRLRRWAGSIRVITLLLSGVVTIALGIRWPEYAETLRNVAFVIGVVSTTLVSVDLYFDYRGLWIEHEEAEWRLHRLKDRIAFYIEGRTDEQLNATTVAGFHESYQWIWDNLSTHWLTLRKNINK